MTNLKRSLCASLTLGMIGTAGTALADDAPVVEAEGSVEVTAPTVTVTAPTATVITTDPDVYVEPAPTYRETTVVTTTVEDRDSSLLSGVGLSITAGAGGGGFTNETLRDTTEVGANWDARLTVGTMLPIAFEASYIGSAQYLDTFGLNNDAVLVGNGAQGALRVNVLPGRMLTPFVFGGAAWRHYELSNVEQNTSSLEADDDVLEIPMGAGFGLRTGGLMVDLRGEYRATFKETMVPSGGDDNGTYAPMNRWGASLNAGVAF